MKKSFVIRFTTISTLIIKSSTILSIPANFSACAVLSKCRQQPLPFTGLSTAVFPIALVSMRSQGKSLASLSKIIETSGMPTRAFLSWWLRSYMMWGTALTHTLLSVSLRPTTSATRRKSSLAQKRR